MNTKHVPSLELCQEFNRLCKDKGIVVPETEYYWIGDSIKNMSLDSIQNTYKITGSPFDGDMQQNEYLFCFPAPLVSELGETFNKVGAKNFIKAYGDVFNFPGTSMIGDLGVINLMRNPNMGMKMINYLLKSGLITEL